MASRKRVDEANDACMYAMPPPPRSLSVCLLELVIVVSVDDQALLLPHAIRGDTPPPTLPLSTAARDETSAAAQRT